VPGAIVIAAYDAFFIGRPVSYSRNHNFYGRHLDKFLTCRAVCRAVDRLDAACWINHFKQDPGNLGWQSAFEATQALIDAVQDILTGKPRLHLLNLRNVTILRDANGAPIRYKQTREIDRQDSKTERFNEGIISANIGGLSSSNVTQLTNMACPMARIYNGTFGRGGRYYPMGASWQNIKSEARRMLTIDGEPVVELDFDGMHIAMLYAEANLPLPTDCHDLFGWASSTCESFKTMTEASQRS
jgi:hypothetical protein